MDLLQDPESRAESFPPFSPNGQLPTPALSPAPEDRSPPDEDAHTESKLPVQHVWEVDPLSEFREGGKDEHATAKMTDGASDSRDVARTGSERQRHRKSSTTKPPSSVNGDNEKDVVLKLSPEKIHELTSSPKSLPLRPLSPEHLPPLAEAPVIFEKGRQVFSPTEEGHRDRSSPSAERSRPNGTSRKQSSTKARGSVSGGVENTPNSASEVSKPSRLSFSSRTVSTPPVMGRKLSSSRNNNASIEGPQPMRPHHRPIPLDLDSGKSSSSSGGLKPPSVPDPVASPMPPSIPLPPLSIPTYLQLELSSEKPSPLYIHRSATNDFPYESSRIKFERLLNFLILPFELEQSLWFGALACLDAWLYTFTILPLRFLKALWILGQSWSANVLREVRDITKFIYEGVGRVWQRRRRSGSSPTEVSGASDEPSGKKSSSTPISPRPPTETASGRENGVNSHIMIEAPSRKHPKNSVFRHRRTKSVPSALLPDHKADILKGLLVLATCILLMRFDSSKTYHNIRGQSAIKLYVIYNVLEVCDRLFSALGQDILECLLSRETLERNPDGRSKVIRPFWMFLLALVYNAIHATALFYQVITLNVAVNSYSNALLTLLMSNQFVEIKGTVFKKFEKENLFQLTCADMVERFQLWLMLMIIALRNIVEVGGLSIKLGDVGSAAANGLGGNNTNAPFRSTSIIPKSFTIFPKWTGQVLGPFLLVLGSEMLVDWLKHAYITKFNNTKPTLYGRFLDVLAKDYYSHAFADQNLTKRLGLPVIPLACLFIRASIQTYHMFLATHMPLPIPSTATSLAVDESSATSSPATTAALAHIDHIFRRALGRSSFGAGVAEPAFGFNWWSMDDFIAFGTMLIVFLVAYFVLLAFKLVLGMCLLSFARRRYKGMKEREREVHMTEGKRVGGWGVVEVEDDKKRWIYADDPDGLRALREREVKAKEKEEKGTGVGLGGVKRYDMVAKRIW